MNDKKMKIMVGVNTLTSVDTEIYGSHSNFWYRCGKNYPNTSFIKYHPRRLSIDNMRNSAANMALAHECEYLMFIDDDIIVQPDTLDHLLAADKDVVMAETYIRGYPYNPMFFRFIANKDGNMFLDHYHDSEKDVDENGLLKCDAVGFSCVLIKCELLKKMHTPYFMTGTTHTEDIYFCMKALSEFPDVSIYTTMKCPTGHLLDKLVLDHESVKWLRESYELRYGKPEANSDDRKVEYIEKCLNSFGPVLSDKNETEELEKMIFGAKE